MRKVILILLEIGLLIGAGVLLGQEKPTYQPNETQSLRLQIKQRDAVIAQKDMQAAQAVFQSAVNVLRAEGEKVKKENNWPLDVKFDPDTLTFDMPKLTTSPSRVEEPRVPVKKP